jgi:D-serine deaminase-like pyridoxal phosphate-dependent protein
MDRCGVDTADEALSLARHVRRLRGLRFDGLTGYEGHCSMEFDPEARLRKQQRAMDFFVEVADRLETSGVACHMLSAGGTATWSQTAANPRITEIQAGSYALMDRYHARLLPDSGFEHALTILSTVVSRHGHRLVLDCGSKSVADAEMSTIVGHDLKVHQFDEEHGMFDVDSGAGLDVGDKVALVPGYGPSTVNLYDAYHVVEGSTVVDVWPVVPRGPGHHGLTLG